MPQLEIALSVKYLWYDVLDSQPAYLLKKEENESR